jgi:tetratricopeptide (TPR) repeat protein
MEAVAHEERRGSRSANAPRGRLSEEELNTAPLRNEMRTTSTRLMRFMAAAVARLSKGSDASAPHGRALASPRDDFARGWRYLQLEEFLDAERAFRAVLNERPDDGDASLYLGMALAGQGRHAEALAPLRTAAEARPLDAEVHWRLGISLRETGELFLAMSAMREALTLRPGLYDVEAALDDLVSVAARSASRTSPVRARSLRRGARRRSHRYTRRTMPASSRELRVGA